MKQILFMYKGAFVAFYFLWLTVGSARGGTEFDFDLSSHGFRSLLLRTM